MHTNLKDSLLSTLRFFDLQDIPLTLLELHRFLLGDLGRIKLSQDEKWELFKDAPIGGQPEFVRLEDLLDCLENQCQAEAGYTLGFYHLSGRSEIARRRWQNYAFGIFRERRIKRYLFVLRYLPFVRGVAVGGSQALGQQRQNSDIDLFIVAAPGFLWLARTLVSAYFQVLGMRRHGRRVQNRFCLNHYVGLKPVDRERNLYKAMEYARLRPAVYPQGVAEFLRRNRDWVNVYLPHFGEEGGYEAQSWLQKIFERLLANPFGIALNAFLGFLQKLKIRQDEFTFVLPDELSFHPHSQHRALLSKFFSL